MTDNEQSLLNLQKALNEYEEEIGVEFGSINELINSHRRQRQLVQESVNMTQEQWGQAREEMKKVILRNEYVSIQELSSMSVQDLASLVSDAY